MFRIPESIAKLGKERIEGFPVEGFIYGEGPQKPGIDAHRGSAWGIRTRRWHSLYWPCWEGIDEVTCDNRFNA